MKEHLQKMEIVAYLSEEVAPSEKRIIQAHLADCEECQEELYYTAGLEKQLRTSLQAQAAQAVPAEGVWERVRLQLPSRPKENAKQRGIQMRKSLVFTMAMILLAFGLVYTTVPAVRALVDDLVMSYFRSELPNDQGGIGVGFGGEEPFIPLAADYFPDDFEVVGNYIGFEDAPGISSMTTMFDDNERFIMLIQSAGEALPGLPEGELITIDGQSGVLIRIVDVDEYLDHLEDFSMFTTMDVISLVWFEDNVMLEMVSNFPQNEVILIAESLAPMEAGLGD
ncbi:MAG: hypothetical protein FVQ83_01780 [Chloroflexi bacterium]|nr:hypothetical protein [Chloroflexota bacterium]